MLPPFCRMRKWSYGFVSLSALTLSSCVVQSHRWTPAHFSEYVHLESAPISDDNKSRADELCPAGMPNHQGDWPKTSTEFVVRDGYALEFSNELKIPLWVCEHVTKSDLNGKQDRSNDFRPDPEIKGPRSELADYSHSGYDRGHQAPSGDQTTSEKRNSETFYLSNMAPQVPAFNQRVWRSLEDQARAWARAYGEVWVVTGGLLYDPKEDNKDTADGWIKYTVIGDDGVAVPTHFYKIIARKAGNGSWETLSFVLENRSYRTPYDWTQVETNIAWIEDRSGLVLLPGLSSTAKRRTNPLWP